MTTTGTTADHEVRVAVETEEIHDELKTYCSWIVWQYEERDGEITKVLYSPHTGRRAKTDDMRTWGTFEDAIDAYAEGDYAGIGYVFSSGDRYTGVDIDGCRDPETGVIEPWAEKIISDLGGYAEVSPSGEGVHVIIKGELPKESKHRREKNRRKLEVYSQRRFFTVTGRRLK